MNNKFLFLFIIILVFSCTSKPGPEKYQLVWSDEFNYSGLPDTQELIDPGLKRAVD